MSFDVMGSTDPKTLQDNFIKLLSAEMKWQDPTNPVDTKDFTQQLASLSMVAQSAVTNSHLEKIASSGVGLGDANHLWNYTSYIGRDITADVSKTNLTNGSAKCAFEVRDQVDAVMLSVHNLGGDLVFNRHVSGPSKGINAFEWDGRDNDGNYVQDGEYEVRITGQDGAALPSMIQGSVKSVQMIGNSPYLSVGSAFIAPNQITGIYEHYPVSDKALGSMFDYDKGKGVST